MGGSELRELTKKALHFRDERDWGKFHNSKDLALSLSLEAAEVLEHFQWKNGKELEQHLASKRGELGDELSDVLYWVLLLAHENKIDLGQAFVEKLRKNELKYPVAKAKGSSSKYTEL